MMCMTGLGHQVARKRVKIEFFVKFISDPLKQEGYNNVNNRATCSISYLVAERDNGMFCITTLRSRNFLK